MPPCNCHHPFPRPEPFSPLPRPGKVPDWGKWIRDRLAEKGALLAFPSVNAFPDPGAGPNLYLAEDTNIVYRWDGAHYQVVFDPDLANDVLEYEDRGHFPETGSHGKLYIATDTGSLYRWDDTGYAELLPGKADKVVPAAEGNLAALDAQGNLADSGKKPGDFATATQGAKADTAVQVIAVGASTVEPGEGGVLALPVSPSVESSSETTIATSKAVKTVNDKVITIEGKIPSQASASNQLADKDFVNSSIATETSTFRDTFNLVTDLQLPLNATHEQVAAAVKTELGQTDYDKNDYVFVQIPQDLEHTDAMKQVDRYKCVETGVDPVVKSWEYEWTLNNSSFTAAQWAAINSGITSGDVTKLGGIAAGAQVNVIETVKVNGTALTPQDKAVNIPVPTLDDTVMRTSANGVKSSGIWAAIWGALAAIPSGFTSLYDWVVAQLVHKRDYTDRSYNTQVTVNAPALHAILTSRGSQVLEYYLPCTEDMPATPAINHVYTWRKDGAECYITQGVSVYSTIWILFGSGGEQLATTTTDNANDGWFPDLTFVVSANSEVTTTKVNSYPAEIHDTLALNSEIPTSLPWSAITGKPQSYTPSAHASTHASNGSDPITPSAIGALGNSGAQRITNGSLKVVGGNISLDGTHKIMLDDAFGIGLVLDGNRVVGISFGDGAAKNVVLPLDGEDTIAFLSNVGILAFDPTATYAVGAKVVYSNAVWNCTTAVSTAGAWTGATNWTKLFDLAVDSTPTANSNSLMTSGAIKTALDGKANRASNPTAGNLAALDSNGNPTDAGYHFEVRNGIPCIVQYT